MGETAESGREREGDPSMSECATTPGAVLALIASPVSGSGHLRSWEFLSSSSLPSSLANCVFINRDRDVRFCFGAARGSSFFFSQRDGKVWRSRRWNWRGSGFLRCSRRGGWRRELVAKIDRSWIVSTRSATPVEKNGCREFWDSLGFTRLCV